jgi:hypothetical protein
MLGCGKHNVQMGHARDHLPPARLPIGTEIGKKGRLSWIPGASLVKRGGTGCFYRLSHGVMAEEASFGKVVSYQWLKAFTGCIRPPESHMSHL